MQLRNILGSLLSWLPKEKSLVALASLTQGADSLWGRFKVGKPYGQKLATLREAMDEVIDWLSFYNHRQLHLTLGQMSPIKFEKR